jgi:NAD(P)H-dependent FMN reductase
VTTTDKVGDLVGSLATQSINRLLAQALARLAPPQLAQSHLRSVLCFCNAPLMNTVEASIQFRPGLITPAGEVANESTEKFLRNDLDELHVFIARVLAVLPKDS